MHRWIIVLAFCLATPAQADTLFGIYAGYGSWHHDSTGDINASGLDLDMEEDLALGDDQDDLYYLALEHGIPFLPNVRAQHSSFGSDGAAEASRTLEFNGLTIQPPTGFETDIFVEQTDLILYYELLDNVVSWDVGLGARKLEGSIDMRTSLARTSVEFEGTIPMVYTAFRLEMLAGWWAAAEAQGVSYDGNELLDGSVKLGWESPIGLGLEAGFKWVRIKLDDVDDITNASIDYQGPFAALNYHF